MPSILGGACVPREEDQIVGLYEAKLAPKLSY